MQAPMTIKGAQRLRAELDELKSVKRPAVIQAIAEARAHGDLKENAEYHAAREQQGFIEGRIKQLEGELSNAQIIDISRLNAGSKVVFGATVVLADTETDKETTYQVVGDLEADIKLGLIAISSPLTAGRAWPRRPCCCLRAADSVDSRCPNGWRTRSVAAMPWRRAKKASAPSCCAISTCCRAAGRSRR